jgi:CBS domain-containing protein
VAQSIREVMTSDPISIPQSAPVQEAAQVMRDSDIGDVIVLDDSDKICGIVTDRDIATRVAAEGKDPRETLLGEICSRDVQALSPDDSVGDAVKLMSDRAVRRLPVIENGAPVGIVSLGDLAVAKDPESALADISGAAPSN